MGLTVVAHFAVIAGVSLSGIAPLENLQPLYCVFSGMTSGNLTLITVVVAINRVLLSRTFATPNELGSQIEGIIDYREGIEVTANGVAPVEPLDLLQFLVGSTRREVKHLGNLARSETSEEI